jgi:hypothetical protein
MTIEIKRGIRIQIHDTGYLVTAAYLNGVAAAKRGSSFRSNPHRYESQAHYDWASGHSNEETGEHAIARII